VACPRVFLFTDRISLNICLRLYGWGWGQNFLFSASLALLGGNFYLLIYSVFAAHCSCVTLHHPGDGEQCERL